jgi:alkylation response protein AidB-like acyl-CoA dehydrogenase
MDFQPTDAQRLLVNTAREWLRRRCPPELVQAMATDPRGIPEDLWSEIAMLGWPGLLVPADLGGSGGSLLDVLLLVEEMGRAGLPGPFVSSGVVATTLLLAAASPAQQRRLLPGMALGEELCAVALAEEDGTADPRALTLAAEPGQRVTGRKLFVRDAHLADHVVLVARGRGGVSLFLIEADRPGLAVAPMETISGEKCFEVVLSGVEVRAEDLLGPAGGGGAPLGRALTAGALARAAELVGGAARALELSVEHARTRVQSGKPIGSFQAIQHHCADMLRHVDGARYLLYRAAWKAETGQDSAADVAMAKAHAGEACLAVARKAHQILGAIGYCEEHILHRLHKRMQAASVDFGDSAEHLETVAAAIGLV